MQKKYPELYSKEFVDFCTKEVIPLCEDEEFKSIQRKISNTINIKFSLGILLLISCIPTIFVNSFFIFFTMFSLAIYLIYLQIADSFNLDLKLKMLIENKKSLILAQLFSYYKNCTYSLFFKEQNNIIEKLNNSKIFSCPQEASIAYEDFFKLKYKELDIEMCEILINEECDNETSNTDISVSNSNIFFNIKRKTQNENETIILQNEIIKKFILPEENIIKLESVDFNKKFTVSSTSQIEARKILTPFFIEKLLKLSNKEDFSKINLSVQKDFINIIISHKKGNLFKPINLFRGHKDTITDILRNYVIEHREFLSLLDELGIEHLSKI